MTRTARPRRLNHVVAFDDAPFDPAHRGDVAIVGTVYAALPRLRLQGVLSGKVRRDGANSTDALIRLVSGSRHYPQLHLVLLQGIAFAGFNVVDIGRLHEALRLPVLVVSRKRPDLDAVKRALLARVPGGARKWRLVERAGKPEPVSGIFVQRAGLTLAEARRALAALTAQGRIPEPLRAAHLIAGGITTGESSGPV